MCSGEDGGHSGGDDDGAGGRGDAVATVSGFCFLIYCIHALPFSEERATNLMGHHFSSWSSSDKWNGYGHEE